MSARILRMVLTTAVCINLVMYWKYYQRVYRLQRSLEAKNQEIAELELPRQNWKKRCLDLTTATDQWKEYRGYHMDYFPSMAPKSTMEE